MASTLPLFLVFAWFTQPNASPQQDAASSITGIYSDMRLIGESGDVVGTEVFLLKSFDWNRIAHHVLFQHADGSPGSPTLVAAKLRGDVLEFELPASFKGWGTFKGRVVKGHLVGRWSGTVGEMDLPQRPSYWQTEPAR
jgi:hypothetical protein